MLNYIAKELDYDIASLREIFPHFELVKDEIVPPEHKEKDGNGTVHVYLANNPPGTQDYLKSYYGDIPCQSEQRPIVRHFFFIDNIKYLMFEHLYRENDFAKFTTEYEKIKSLSKDGLITDESSFCFSGNRPYLKTFGENFHYIRTFFLPKKTRYKLCLFEPNDKSKPVGIFWYFSYEKVPSWGEHFHKKYLIPLQPRVLLSKPFIVLSGISGTGKTRFVREQAKNFPLEDTYQLIPVRPDWHEPSDLLGYISRLSKDNKPKYIVTEILRFIVKAWIEIAKNSSIESDTLNVKNIEEIRPYWLCLDEMNLAPIEQYFADYLSILETRVWAPRNTVNETSQQICIESDWTYSCEPLLSLQKWITEDRTQEGVHILEELQKDLGLSKNNHTHEKLWKHFEQHGISIPFNLIVVGTVNMDDTTHGFSRKVLDRAVVMDFLEFFPTKFDAFFNNAQQFKPLTFPRMSNAQFHEDDFEKIQCNNIEEANIDVKEASMKFLQEINKILERTPFELSYRAMNELLLAVLSLRPTSQTDLYAVWDDFLMQKVLPRIEGDQQKLLMVPENFPLDDSQNEQNSSPQNILEALEKLLQDTYSIKYSNDTKQRTDFYRTTQDKIPWRSPKKIKAMRYRLKTNRFTSFWT